METQNLTIEQLQKLLSEKIENKKNAKDIICDTLRRHIFDSINNARKEMQENALLDDSEINTIIKYFSIGINLNHKVEDNSKDKSLVINIQHRTRAEYLKAEKEQQKDVKKTVKISSYDTKQAHNRANVDVEKTLNKIANRSGIKRK